MYVNQWKVMKFLKKGFKIVLKRPNLLINKNEVTIKKIGTINIGERQKGRLCARSVINVEANSELILKSIYKIYSNDFKKIMKQNTNPYENGNSTEKIIEILNNKGMIANPITLKNYFEKDDMLNEVGGTEYLVKLTRFSSSTKQGRNPKSG